MQVESPLGLSVGTRDAPSATRLSGIGFQTAGEHP